MGVLVTPTNMAAASSVITWDEVVPAAVRWAGETRSGFSIEKVDNVSNRVVFAGVGTSFYIAPPEEQGDSWTVWSDDSECACVLATEIDYLTAPERMLVTILDKVAGLLTNKRKQNSDTDSNGSIDDDDDDDDDDDEKEEEEEDSDMYDYYQEDADAESCEVVLPKQKQSSPDDDVSADDFFTGDGSPAAVHRLLADLKCFNKSSGKFGITGRPQGDNLFVWDVELGDFDSKSLLQSDLEAYSKRYNRKPVVSLKMKFPKDYPMSPPFVRVIRPRFQFLTGHITIGGSVCMQMLTRSGWSPSNDIESILIQVRAEIMSDPNARLASNPDSEYSESEAKVAFERMVQRYGWNRSK